MRQIYLYVGILFMVISTTACSHSLTVKNLNEYQKNDNVSASKKLKIGMVSSNKDPHTEIFFKATASELAKYAESISFADNNPSLKLDSVDYWVKMSFQPSYDGSGWNFLINWPGFLIWTPAWHGYVYKVNYLADITITEAKTNKVVETLSVPFKFDVRHADIGRTWTEVGWLEVSIIPFISGFVFTQYDDTVSPLVPHATKDVIADNIAKQVITELNNFSL